MLYEVITVRRPRRRDARRGGGAPDAMSGMPAGVPGAEARPGGSEGASDAGSSGEVARGGATAGGAATAAVVLAAAARSRHRDGGARRVRVDRRSSYNFV